MTPKTQPKRGRMGSKIKQVAVLSRQRVTAKSGGKMKKPLQGAGVMTTIVTGCRRVTEWRRRESNPRLGVLQRRLLRV